MPRPDLQPGAKRVPLYELVNPSDEYHFEAQTRLAAAVTAYTLGRGSAGAKEVGGDWSTPILFGWGEFFKVLGLENLTDAEAVQNRRDVVAALKSVTIGPRSEFAEAVILTGDERLKRHDRKRTSMSDFGRLAWKLAEKIAKQLPDEAPQPEAPTPPRSIDDGQVAYEGFSTACGGRNPVTNYPLSAWCDLQPPLREAWRAAADALRMWWEQAPLRAANVTTSGKLDNDVSAPELT